VTGSWFSVPAAVPSGTAGGPDVGTQEGTPGALYCGQRGGAALASASSARAQRGARAPLTHRALHACQPQSLHRFSNASAAQAIELNREAAITATRPATSDLRPDETKECA